MKKIIAMLSLSFVLMGSVFAGGIDNEDNTDYINGQVDSTIKEIDKAVVSNKDLTQYIYYFSQTCSHCAKVNKFFTENKIEEKFNLIKKDTGVFEAVQELIKIRQSVGLDPNMVTVPFLVYRENGQYKYLDGDKAIIDFFTKRLAEFYPEENKDNENNEDKDIKKDENGNEIKLDTDATKSNDENIEDKKVKDNDEQNQNLLLYFILSGLLVLLGAGSFIILKKK